MAEKASRAQPPAPSRRPGLGPRPGQRGGGEGRGSGHKEGEALQAAASQGEAVQARPGLRREGLSYSEIVRKIEEEYGERLSKGQVSEWCRGIHRPTGKVHYKPKTERPAEFS